MASGGSVTHWLGQLQAGEAAAAQPLWERYFHRLVGLARLKLQGAPRRAADEEDVALSAFDSFCRGAERGQFPQLHDRHDLWRLLVTLTARKAYHLRRDEQRHKRGGGAVLDEGALREAPQAAAAAGLDQIVGHEPTPEFAAQVAEECQRLLALLDEAELRSIALWKMEGETTEQMAQKLRRSPRTVERKLERIRTLWEREVGP